MSRSILRIATRTSVLAMWQAQEVEKRLKILYPDLQVVLNGMTTQGDKILDTPLARIGGKGLFVKELEQGMLDGQADIAVHSMKDVPVELPSGLHLPVIMAREDPLDAFVSNDYKDLDSLPLHSIVGTSSLRRECQLRAYRPDLTILSLRGNVHTRLQRLDEGKYAAIILASAGLKRLGLDDRIRCQLTTQQSLPAIGQGAIGIECRTNDTYVNNLIAPLMDSETSTCVLAERAMNRRLQGGCQVPIAGYAVRETGELFLRGLVGSPDGKQILRAEERAPIAQAESLGTRVAEALLAQGAELILSGGNYLLPHPLTPST